jgi:DNA-directed RNA polymerase specialized sigma24 family protein
MIEGDMEAFRFFFEKYYSHLCNLVYVYLHDPLMAEEIVTGYLCLFLGKKREEHH